MRLTVLLLALACPLASLAADSTQVARQLRDQAMAGSGAFALVESLTSEIGPRLPGSAAGVRAEAWAERQLKRLGYDRVWRQPVTIPRWLRRHERARVLGAFEQSLLISALGFSLGSYGPLQAEVVELADIDALKAVSDDRLRGKIVFLSHRMQRARDGAGYSKSSEGRSQGPREAAERGAVGFLLRSAGTDSHRFPHTGNLSRKDGIDVPIPAAALSNPDADQLQRLLDRGQPVQIELDIDVGFDGDVVVHNIIGEIDGRQPKAGWVLLGAHLDSWDLGTGAIDDGAGIAITFEAGARIAALTQRPRRGIRVVAFAAEELGLLGAKVYAAEQAEVDRHVVGMESDFGAGRIYALKAGINPAAWPALQSMGELLRPLGIEVDRRSGGPGPDIGPLYKLGMPWISLAQDGSDYFDYHHTADDTLDKIDARALDQQVAAYAALAWLLADSDIDLRPAPPPPVE